MALKAGASAASTGCLPVAVIRRLHLHPDRNRTVILQVHQHVRAELPGSAWGCQISAVSSTK